MARKYNKEKRAGLVAQHLAENLHTLSTNVRTQVIDALSGGREGKPHSSPEGREASAGRKLGRLIEKSKPFKKGGRIGYAGGGGNRPRPHGPHMWVKTSGAVMSGKKVGIQIK